MLLHKKEREIINKNFRLVHKFLVRHGVSMELYVYYAACYSCRYTNIETLLLTAQYQPKCLLANTFCWRDTPEGDSFWRGLNGKYYKFLQNINKTKYKKI